MNVLAGLMCLLCATAYSGCASDAPRYSLRGQIISKNAAKAEITVKHDEIPGYMPAMTMTFKVSDPAEMQGIEPGDMIDAELLVGIQGSGILLERIRVTDRTGRHSSRREPQIRFLDAGDPVPDIELTNQDGKTFFLRDLAGKAVLMTFIYTRCPFPNFCPRLSSQFARLQQSLKKTPTDYQRTHLVSISIDPKFDTAPVLRRYGLSYLKNDPSGFQHWDFAFTAPDELALLAKSFGLSYFETDNEISHTMNIVLIGADGRVLKYWAGDWSLEEIESALRKAAVGITR